MGKTTNDMHSMIKLHEHSLPKKDATLTAMAIKAERIQKNNRNKKPQNAAKGKNQGKGKSKLTYDPKPKIPPPPKKDYTAKDTIYHQCSEVGHWRMNFPIYLTKLMMKKKKQASGASTLGIFTIELYSFPNKSWVMSLVVVLKSLNTTQGIRGSKKLNLGALNLYAANGHRAAVEAIRSFNLCLPNIEYMSQEFLDHLKEHEIVSQRTLYTQHNGVFERRNRSLIDMVRSMTSQTALPKSFLDYALESVARILNMMPTKKDEKTSYEVWNEQAPKISYLKVWGCEVLVKRDTLVKPDKLKPRFVKCIFVGYLKETMCYLFYYPPENKIIVAQNAEFF
uniref:Retrotransposon protein, putative, Ty1-copia subclass n=1 Tax=Tanacetum cinerariifolium TaxID=118510 RepID=A0A699H7A9_TANCI|nr:retrotransposon protein, putative, Ty1-copia subclass [Tanacetum cinerariifolium]